MRSSQYPFMDYLVMGCKVVVACFSKGVGFSKFIGLESVCDLVDALL